MISGDGVIDWIFLIFFYCNFLDHRIIFSFFFKINYYFEMIPFSLP